MKAIVVIFGNSAHGKDTLADMLAKHLGGAGRIAYATALKEMVKAFVGCTDEHLWGTQAQKMEPEYYGRSARYYCQWLGTEIGREMIDPNIWLHRCADRALAMGQDYVVVSDGRFWNELSDLKSYLGDRARVVNVLIYRPEIPDPVGRPPTRFWRFVAKVARLFGITVPIIHGSESEVLEMRRRSSRERLFDHVVVNDSLDVLDGCAAQIAKRVKQVTDR